MWTHDPEEDGPIIVTRNLLFPPRTRLMCPDCGTISNNHKISEPFFAQYSQSPFIGAQYVCYHTCHRCGYCDNTGHGFTDSGNFHCDDTDNLYEWNEELTRLEDEISELRERIKKGEALFARLWQTNDDAQA